MNKYFVITNGYNMAIVDDGYYRYILSNEEVPQGCEVAKKEAISFLKSIEDWSSWEIYEEPIEEFLKGEETKLLASLCDRRDLYFDSTLDIFEVDEESRLLLEVYTDADTEEHIYRVSVEKGKVGDIITNTITYLETDDIEEAKEFFGNGLTFETCPNCGKEVLMRSDKVGICTNCKYSIAPCSNCDQLSGCNTPSCPYYKDLK